MSHTLINSWRQSTRTKSSLGVLGMSVLLTLATGATARAEQPAAEPVREQFRSGGTDIAVESFEGSQGGKHPVLVVLHGNDGACASLYRTTARTYAAQGYVVLLVHYFDRTGKSPADLARYRQLFFHHFRQECPAEQRKQMRALFDAWTETVADAVTYARGRADVDGARVSLVGLSLGGVLALHAATEKELKLAALVELFGALPAEARARLKKLPPTLIIHGDADEVVPVEQAYVLAGLLVSRKQRPEVEVYPGAGHLFFKGETLQKLCFLQAKLRTDAFLAHHLKPPQVTKP